MSEEKLPLEILKEKYIPVSDVQEKLGISVTEVMRLINSRKLKYAEFKAPGSTRRTPHINPDDLLVAMEKEVRK